MSVQSLVKVEQNEEAVERGAAQNLGDGARVKRRLELAAHSRASRRVFERKGADLVMEKKITLLEALTGLSFELEHLDGQKYTVATTPGEVINPGTKK